jgi:hypothetical protein
MGVAVEDPDAGHLPLQLHPALRATVAAQGGRHPGRREAELGGGGEGGGRVQRVMVPGHPHGQLGQDLPERAVARGYREADRHPAGTDAADPVVGMHGLAVASQAIVRKAGRHGFRAGIVGAGHDQPGRAAAEGGERGLDIGQAGVVVQVVGLHVGDHREVRREQQERPVALVGLGDEIQAGAVLSAKTGLAEHAADHVAGIGAALAEHGGEHRGRGGLAVGPGHRDHPPARHHRGERGRPVNHPHPAPRGFGQLRVVRADRAGHHERVAGAELTQVARGVPDVDRGTGRPKLVKDRRGPGVAAGHADAAGQHDPRDARHARPADAGEVHPPQCGGGHRVSRRQQLIDRHGSPP